MVSQADLNIVHRNRGNGTPPNSIVPKPTTGLMLIMILGRLCGRYSRAGRSRRSLQTDDRFCGIAWQPNGKFQMIATTNQLDWLSLIENETRIMHKEIDRWAVIHRLIAALVCLLVLWAALPAVATTSRYRLSWRDDPSRTMVIGWDQQDGQDPTVYFGPTDRGQTAGDYAHAVTPDVVHHYRGMNNHFVRLTGLEPDTAYYFIIKDSNSVSRRMWFRTAPDQPRPFSFIAGGDSRTNTPPRQEGNRLVAKLRPLFICHGGDYMGEGTAEEWQQWLDDWQLTISEDGRIYPLVPAHGNHENRDMEMVYRLFDMPRPEMYFAFNIGGPMLRLYTLNTEIENDPSAWAGQRAWFEQDLKLHRQSTWKFVQYHRPMRPHTAKKAEGLERIASWAGLLYDYGVDLVVECDTHMVKRTYPLKPSNESGSYESFIRDDARGTVFIGEGSWGAPTRPTDDDKPWTMASDSFYQFKWIHVTSERVEIRSVRFENVDAVASVSDDDPFEVPDGLVLWEPPTGAVLALPFSTEDPTYTEGGHWAEVFSPGSSWRFLDTGVAPGADWVDPVFDDSGWPRGEARLGYGGDGEVTELSYGPDAGNKHPMYFFRSEFDVDDHDDIERVSIEVLADDGCVVYLNGREVGRLGMVGGDLGDTFFANRTVGNATEYEPIIVDAEQLKLGENTLAICVYQANGRSSDLSLDARVRVLRRNGEEQVKPDISGGAGR